MKISKYPSKSNERIIWAIDPFEEPCETHSQVLAALENLSKMGAVIEPVYVLSPDEFDLEVQFNSPWLKRLRPTAENVLEHYL